jgi:hypothetical protein
MPRVPWLRVIPRLSALCVFALTALNPVASRSEEVLVHFTAVVTVVDDAFCQCISTVHTGDTLVGYYVYDSELADMDPDTNKGVYEDVEAPHRIWIYHKNHTFSSDPSDPYLYITVDIPGGQDEFAIGSYNNLTDPFRTFADLYLIWLSFFDATGQALTSDSLLTGAPDLPAYTYRDLKIWGGDLEWAIWADVISVGLGYATGIGEGSPSGFRVDSYPNPFNPSVTIDISLNVGAQVDLSIYDVSGRCIKTMAHERLPAGPHIYTWDGRDTSGTSVASGVYFAILKADDKQAGRKLVLLR